MELFGKKILQDRQLPISLKKKTHKKQAMDQCGLPTMTYSYQTWSLNKQLTNKLRTAQRAMEREMLGLKLQDKVSCLEIRGWIHEGPSRYRDHKASRPDSYGPLTCSEEVVFMKAGQQGPQLSARVFLNHDLVTDCACVLKGMCTFSTR